jgi:hypothetical protein
MLMQKKRRDQNREVSSILSSRFSKIKENLNDRNSFFTLNNEILPLFSIKLIQKNQPKKII